MTVRASDPADGLGDDDGAIGGDRLGAALLLLPAALFAWPGPFAPLEHQLLPEQGGAGLALLAALPVSVWLCTRARIRPRAALALLLVPAAAALAARTASGDTLEAARAALLALVALVALFGGGALRGAGRRVIERGLVLLSLAWTVGALGPLALAALVERLPDALAARLASLGPLARGAQGVLGNTGLLSQAALPGAIAGAWVGATQRGAWGRLGLFACLLFVVHAALAPALTGGIALCVALTAGALVSPWSQRVSRIRATLGGCAAFALFAVVATASGGGALGARPQEPEALASAPPAAPAGGFAVRARIWRRVPALVCDHALFGTGPGQFQATFPPYRDPAEIELSTHGRALGYESEVEHAHSDWLQGFCDFGLLGGAAFALFLLLGARAAARALARENVPRAALGSAALGVLVAALAHEPLLRNPAASPLAFALLGVALAGPAEKPRRAGRALRVALALGALVLALAATPTAWSLVRHGRALTPRFEDGAAAPSLDVAAALRARPDSPSALAQAAHQDAKRAEPGGRALARARWAELLARRPHCVEGLLELGRLEALDGETDAARARWERVLALDPAHPLALAHLARLDVQARDVAGAAARLEALRERGRLAPSLVHDIAGLELVRGGLEHSLALLGRFDAELAPPAPERVLARAQRARAEGERAFADALECAAHWLWAREHMAADDAPSAVRSYRQALQRSARHVEGGAALLRWELAAALVRAGEHERARELVAGLAPSTGAALPEWAEDALVVSGLLRR